MEQEWTPLVPKRLDVDASMLAAIPSSTNPSRPQLAKDEDYARAVQEAWKNEVQATRRRRCTDSVSESKSIIYRDSEGTCLYGEVVRRSNSSTTRGNDDDDDYDEPSSQPVPGILLFHTAAGPKDVFLHWKADSLVMDETTFPNRGCIVLIADVLSDDVGWAWSSDRTRFNQVASDLFILSTSSSTSCSPDAPSSGKGQSGEGASSRRGRLQCRLQAAINALLAVPGVDPTRLAAMGWCLGGHALVELSRMQVSNLKALISFHGVFDGRPPLPPCHRNEEGTTIQNATTTTTDDETSCQVLICNGAQDPFVSAEMLDAAVATFERNYSPRTVKVLSLAGARHGFTNPAQDFNPNRQSFGFNANAALKSWTQATSLLRNKLSIARLNT